MIWLIKTMLGGVMAGISLVWGTVMIAQSAGSEIPDAIIGVGGLGVAVLIIAWMIRASSRVEATWLSGIRSAQEQAKFERERAERAEARLHESELHVERLKKQLTTNG
jgi:hypothetical protein